MAGQLRFSGSGTVFETAGPRLGLKGLHSSCPYYLHFTMQVAEAEFCRIVGEEAAKDFDPLELLYPKEVPVLEKYDEYVPVDLVRKGFALGVLDLVDVEGMKRRVLSWSDSLTPTESQKTVR